VITWRFIKACRVKSSRLLLRLSHGTKRSRRPLALFSVEAALNLRQVLAHLDGRGWFYGLTLALITPRRLSPRITVG
jgi:hypothetical protein